MSGRLRAGALVVALLAAACGGGSADPSDAAGTATTSSSSTTVSETTTTTVTEDLDDGSEPLEEPIAPEVEVVISPVRDVGFAELAGLAGGLGGEPYVVTSADDRGPGTYRDALSASGRYITFDPALDGATIELESRVEIDSSHLTLDGSGVDITVTGYATKFSGTDIVIAGMAYADVTATGDEDALTFLTPTEPQLIGLFGNTFRTASDGLVDLIWNEGNDVHATVCGNAFLDHDKAFLVHSGDTGREGGRYHVTMCRNLWSDVFQRAPLSRDSFVHQYNSVFLDYGQPDGAGGGSKAGSGELGAEHVLEKNIARPRSAGSVAWNGAVVTEPRAEFAGPSLSDGGRIRIDGSLLLASDTTQAIENEREPEGVFDPPSAAVVLDATPALSDLVMRTAGTCPARSAPSTVNPCAWPALLGGGGAVEVLVSGPVEQIELFIDGESVAQVTAIDVRWVVVPDVSDDRLVGVGELVAVATLADGRTVASEPVEVFVG